MNRPGAEEVWLALFICRFIHIHMLKPIVVTILMILFLKCDFVYAQFNERVKSLNENQTWIGKNGQGFRGFFIKREGDILTVAKENGGKIYKLDMNNLHPKTKKWFLGEWEKKEAIRNRELNKGGKIKPQGVKLSAGVVIDLNRFPIINSTGFKLVDEKKAPRSLIPNFNQSDYGKKTSDCVPNSYAMFLAWWHLRDWVKISKKRDFQDKVDWIHQRLARTMRTRNNSGTGMNKSAGGLTKFFTDEMKSKAAFTFQRVEDYRPENMYQYVKGANCTVLSLSIFNDRKYSGGHAVTLKSMAKDGTLEFNTWGLSLKGKLKVIPDSEIKKKIYFWTPEGRRKLKIIKLAQYEIELINRTDLPDWFVNAEKRFVLDPEKWDGLAVLTPYLPINGDAGIKN